MKLTGTLMLTAAFLWGAYQAVLSPQNKIAWIAFAPALVLGAIGVALMRAGSAAAEAAGGGMLSTSQLDELLARIADGVQRLDAEKAAIDVYDLHEQIDRRFAEDLANFAESRKAMIATHGLQGYADVMNDFAAGERYLNRVWSCSVDGYIDEAHTYLSLSGEQFAAASARLSRSGK